MKIEVTTVVARDGRYRSVAALLNPNLTRDGVRPMRLFETMAIRTTKGAAEAVAVLDLIMATYLLPPPVTTGEQP